MNDHESRLETAQLTETGAFSARCGGLFEILLDAKGQTSIETGMGMHPTQSQPVVLVRINNRFCTGFFPREAKEIARIIEESLEEEPPKPQLIKVFRHLARELLSLAKELDDISKVNRSLQ